MSRFDKIFEARTETAEAENGGKSEQMKAVGKTGSENPDAPVKRKSRSLASPLVVQIPEPPTEPATNQVIKRGRPPAKRSDPNFVGLTTYIRRETHMQAKIALLQEGQGKELSELVEDLIGSWLIARQKSPV